VLLSLAVAGVIDKRGGCETLAQENGSRYAKPMGDEGRNFLKKMQIFVEAPFALRTC
jgi:hypothetical protein